MQNLFKQLENFSVYQTMEKHLAWQGKISGLVADKMLRGKKTPYLYILRAGELESEDKRDFYVTFVSSDLTVTHTPFEIIQSIETWRYENAYPNGPFSYQQTIDDVIHLIMHCPKDSPKPFLA